jgi:hypothetical protein
MVKPLQQRLEHALDLEEIDDKAGLGIDRPLKVQLDAIGVAMQRMTAMLRRHARQAVRGFKAKCLGDLHGRDFITECL